MDVKAKVEKILSEFSDPLEGIEAIRDCLFELSPQNTQPIDRVRWVPIEKVKANSYNPNSVARNEMRLLHTSISHDGFTQPVVVIYDPEEEMYVIVDGFHRYTTMHLYEDIKKRCNGLVPVVVIDKNINDRMASTVRHNRARGRHSVTGMASMVFSMLDNGWTDVEICNELGLEVDELLRLKHVTGFSKLFEDVEYRKSWQTRSQIRLKVEQDRAKHASRRTDKRRATSKGGEKESSLSTRYHETRRLKAPVLAQERIDARKKELDTQFSDHSKKVNSNLLGVTCPSCGDDFYLDRDSVAGQDK